MDKQNGKKCYSIALPIIDESYQYQEIRALAIDQIISDLPEMDLSAEVDLAYNAYAKWCTDRGKKVKFTRDQFPDGKYGGESNRIEFLLGMAAIEFKQLFTYNGLTFMTTNLKTGSCPPVLFGGKWKETGSREDSDYSDEDSDDEDEGDHRSYMAIYSNKESINTYFEQDQTPHETDFEQDRTPHGKYFKQDQTPQNNYFEQGQTPHRIDEEATKLI